MVFVLRINQYFLTTRTQPNRQDYNLCKPNPQDLNPNPTRDPKKQFQVSRSERDNRVRAGLYCMRVCVCVSVRVCVSAFLVPP